MNTVFGPTYARVYDLLYQNKDYAAECDLLERVFRQYASQHVKTVLDLGCRTGNHALLLAAQGYSVVGVDHSEDLLGIARSKAERQRLSIAFHQGDVGQVDLGQAFDAVLMMFAVLGYQTENADVLAALRAARRHLRPNGLLIADIWYGPAVLSQRPGDRVRTIHSGSNTILRTSSGKLDLRRHICTVHFHVWHMNGREIIAEVEERHAVRFFFPRELELFLEVSGFHLLRLGGFPDFEKEPDESTWNVMAVAVAC